MSSIRFRYLGFGLVLVAGGGTAIACGSSGASDAPQDGTGGFVAGTGNTTGSGGTVSGTGNAPGSGGTTGTGNTPGSGGTPPAGGTTGSGGGVSVGGSTGTGDLKIVGSVTKCPDTPAMPPAGSVAACTMAGCSNAHCVPAASVPAGQDTSLLAKCPDGSFCTPDDYIVTTAKFLAKTCTSLEGAEGRCISKCVPQVNVQLTTLPKDNCADTELCAPCFNPIDGTDTKACSQGCDTGPVNKTPVVFESCGGGLGVCVPPALVPANLQTPLKNADDTTAISCTKTDSSGAKYLCAPKDKAKNLNYQFPSCAPSLAAALNPMPGPNGQKGACIPKYLVPIAQQILTLQDAPCVTGTVCAPCYDPTKMPQVATGACPSM